MRDKVYIVWEDNDDGHWADDIILAVCASAKDAEEYIEDWAWARVEARVASSEEMLAKRQEQEKEQIKQRLYITDHTVVGNEPPYPFPVVVKVVDE